MIMTKCGFLPVDIDSDLKEDKIVDILVDLKVPKEEIVDNVHCVHPLFIDFSVQKSRLCLGVDKIDVVYLNNFSESQLAVIGMD